MLAFRPEGACWRVWNKRLGKIVYVYHKDCLVALPDCDCGEGKGDYMDERGAALGGMSL